MTLLSVRRWTVLCRRPIVDADSVLAALEPGYDALVRLAESHSNSGLGLEVCACVLLLVMLSGAVGHRHVGPHSPECVHSRGI